MEIKVKIKKLVPESVLPTYSKVGDAGMDITAISKTVVDKGNYGYIEYGTGLAFQLEEGYYIDIRPRSSISNTGMILANAPGTLDENFIGELKVRFKWIPGTIQYNIGERIAQIMVKKYETVEWIEVEELTETNRGESGFGSSGS